MKQKPVREQFFEAIAVAKHLFEAALAEGYGVAVAVGFVARSQAEFLPMHRRSSVPETWPPAMNAVRQVKNQVRQPGRNHQRDGGLIQCP